MRGVVTVAYGARAQQAARTLVKSLQRFHPGLPVSVVGESVPGARLIRFRSKGRPGRWAKVNLDLLSPYEATLYMDADTRARGDLSKGFDILGDGWPMAICLSKMQADNWLWHIDPEERGVTLVELGARFPALGGGVFFFRRCPEISKLFEHWREEWERWQDQDQAALLRAFCRDPIPVWNLGHTYNTGALVKHDFGRAR